MKQQKFKRKKYIFSLGTEDYTNIASSINSIIQPLNETVNQTRYDKPNYASNITSGALSGAAMGLPLAAATGGLSVAVGAILGAGAGAIRSAFREEQINEQKKQEEEQKRQYEELKRKLKYQTDLSMIQADPSLTLGRENVTGHILKYGGKIKIKPENKGKFTEFAKRNNMSISEAIKEVLSNKSKYSPTTVKRAIFAKNARKWKHAYGTDDFTKIEQPVIPIYGNRHEQGGVNIAPNVEVEGGEAIYGNAIASDRIGTDTKSIADRVKELGLLKEKFLNLYKYAKGNAKNKYKNILERIDKEINRAIKVQEQMKDVLNIDNQVQQYALGEDYIPLNNITLIDKNSNLYKRVNLPYETNLVPIVNEIKNKYDLNYNLNDTGIFSKGLVQAGTTTNNISKNNINLKNIITPDTVGFATTLIDNIGNMILNNRLRKKSIPLPELEPIVPLDTQYNIEPTLKMYKDMLNKSNQIVSENITDSNVATALKLANINAFGQHLATLNQNKEIQELGLRNQNKVNIQQIGQINRQKLDTYKQTKFNKEVQTDFTNISNNLANLQGDLRWLIDTKNMNRYQADILKNEMLKYQESGVWSKTFDVIIQSNPDIAKNFSNEFLQKAYKDAQNKYTKDIIKKILKERNIEVTD